MNYFSARVFPNHTHNKLFFSVGMLSSSSSSVPSYVLSLANFFFALLSYTNQRTAKKNSFTRPAQCLCLSIVYATLNLNFEFIFGGDSRFGMIQSKSIVSKLTINFGIQFNEIEMPSFCVLVCIAGCRCEIFN